MFCLRKKSSSLYKKFRFENEGSSKVSKGRNHYQWRIYSCLQRVPTCISLHKAVMRACERRANETEEATKWVWQRENLLKLVKRKVRYSRNSEHVYRVLNARWARDSPKGSEMQLFSRETNGRTDIFRLRISEYISFFFEVANSISFKYYIF